MSERFEFLSLAQLARRIKDQAITPLQITQFVLDRIQALDVGLHSYRTLMTEQALASAKRATDEIAAGHYRGPLHGIPVAVKDLMYTKGAPTYAGTTFLGEHLPHEDGAVVSKLRDAGAVILGKTHMTEGAFTKHHPDVAVPENPWGADNWTGVSSSGSAVALAAGLCFAALGTDTGGSIRFPSACNNLVGIKPTRGRVSRYGAFPLAESLDHIGPMARTVEDAALMLNVLAGRDEKDPTSSSLPVPDYLATIQDGVKGLRVGVDLLDIEQNVAPEVAETLRAAIDVLVGLGAEIVDVSLPPAGDLCTGWVVTTAVEAARAHEPYYKKYRARYCDVFGALLDYGSAIDSDTYEVVERQRGQFKAAFEQMLESVDVVLSPVMASASMTLTQVEKLSLDPTAGIFKYTAPYDYSGHPTITLPCGFTDTGLPMGMQLIGKPFDESTLIRTAHSYEQNTSWGERHPADLD